MPYKKQNHSFIHLSGLLYRAGVVCKIMIISMNSRGLKFYIERQWPDIATAPLSVVGSSRVGGDGDEGH